MVWLAPTARAVVVQVAMPDPLSGWAPQPVMPPPVKATVPVGFEPVTVAVKVTLWPDRGGVHRGRDAGADVKAFTV